jgi:hypothetical protein
MNPAAQRRVGQYQAPQKVAALFKLRVHDQLLSSSVAPLVAPAAGGARLSWSTDSRVLAHRALRAGLSHGPRLTSYHLVMTQ